MYAVIKTGGKQYKVAVGDKLKVEKLVAAEGASVEIGQVLMVADGEHISTDQPAAQIAVSAIVLGHGRGTKIRVFKMKRRKHYRRTQGHRQSYTEIQITAIGDEKIALKTIAQVETKAVAKVETEVDAKTKATPDADAKVSIQTDSPSAVKAATPADEKRESANPSTDQSTVAKHEPVTKVAATSKPAEKETN